LLTILVKSLRIKQYVPNRFVHSFKTKNGLITPTGTWSGWYFSEELKHALT